MERNGSVIRAISQIHRDVQAIVEPVLYIVFYGNPGLGFTQSSDFQAGIAIVDPQHDRLVPAQCGGTNLDSFSGQLDVVTI